MAKKVSKDELNEQQKRFCHEYLIDLNGKQAAIRAGYTKKTAEVQASRLLSYAKIVNYLNILRSDLSNSLNISKERVLKEYARIAFFDIRKILTVDGGLKRIDELDEDSAAAIAGIESYEQKTGSIEPGDEGASMALGTLRKIKIADKKGALDSICKVLGYNEPEEVNLKGQLSITDQPVTFK